MKSKAYIVTKNKKIIRVYKTTQGEPGIIASLKYEKIEDYDSIELAPSGYEGRKGMDLRELDKDGKVRPFEERVIEKLIPCPVGKKIVDNKIVNKSTLEKIRDKEIKMGEYEKYDEATDKIIPKTPEEIYSTEELEQMERDKLIHEEIKKIAEERLIASGKIQPKN